MKQMTLFAGIVLLGVLAVAVSERRKVEVSANPAALLYLVADTEQELTRLPTRFTRMSDAEEISAGNELAKNYASLEHTGNGGDDPQEAIVVQYLARVGSPLASLAHRKLPFTFHYLPQPWVVNAFALPGGHVYVGAGLLALMDSEDELAAVIGHELEHIDHYHCAERLQREQALRRIPLGEIFQIPVEVFAAGYSKNQELEADREGTQLAVSAGYSATGAVRLFETFARLYKEYSATASTPQQEASQVLQQTLEGYFRSHPLPAERIAQIQKLMATEGWEAHAERDLAVAYVFWTASAQAALDDGRYIDAEQLAAQSLEMQPEQPKALRVLSQAQFLEAKFAEDAKTLRKILQIDTPNPEMVTAYARTLAAADRRTALAEFRRWEESVKGEKPREADVADAGLALLAGDAQPAQKLKPAIFVSANPNAPAWLGELAWWYHVNGNDEQAADFLSEAIQQRPGDARLKVRYAWAAMELRRYSDALETLAQVSGEQLRSEKSMAEAVAHWRAQEVDAALGAYGSALAGHSEWENALWTKALYAPGITLDIQAMHEEREKRRQKAKAAAAGQP
jgi:predicted Zn-dependent protease